MYPIVSLCFLHDSPADFTLSFSQTTASEGSKPSSPTACAFGCEKIWRQDQVVWVEAGNGLYLSNFQLPRPRALPAWGGEIFCCYGEEFLTFQGSSAFSLSFSECLSLQSHLLFDASLMTFLPSPLRTELAAPVSVFSCYLVHTLSVVANILLHFSCL